MDALRLELESVFDLYGGPLLYRLARGPSSFGLKRHPFFDRRAKPITLLNRVPSVQT